MSEPIILSTACPYPQPHERGKRAFIEAVKRLTHEEVESWAREQERIASIFLETERVPFDLTRLGTPRRQP